MITHLTEDMGRSTDFSSTVGAFPASDVRLPPTDQPAPLWAIP